MINIVKIDTLILIMLFLTAILKNIPKEYSMFILVVLGREYWINFKLSTFTVVYIIIGFGIGTLIVKELYYNKNKSRKGNLANFNMIVLVVLEEVVWRQIAMGVLKSLFSAKMQLLFVPFLSGLFLLSHQLKTLSMYIFSCFLYLGSIYFPGINIGLHLGWNFYVLNRNWGITSKIQCK